MSDPDSLQATAAAVGTLGDQGRSAGDALEFFGEAIASLPVGVMLVGHDGIIALVNRETERLFGYAAAELVGQSVDILVPDTSRAAHAALRQAFHAEPLARRMAAGRELFGRRKDGSETAIEVTLAPISWHGAQLVLASVLDAAPRHGLQPDVQTALDERLEFERLVGELGAEFVNLRPGDVDRAIEDALGRLVRVLGLDRSALFQVDESGTFVHTHQWTRPGWAPPIPRIDAREHFPWLLARVQAGDLVSFATLDDVPDEADRASLQRIGTKSNVTVPLLIGGEVWGALTFAAVRESRAWTAADINRLRVIAVLFANALARKLADERLRKMVDEMTALRDRLRQENLYLRHELGALNGTSPLVGHTALIRRVIEQVRQVGPTDSTVLLIGETGTGKTLLANQIHELSTRSEHAMVRVNCAHLSASWVDAESDGAELAAYGRADSRHRVGMELASGSTVFFDEIADLPLEAQASLVRVLQHNKVQPSGHRTPGPGDVRVIAATRKDLKHCIQEGSFRDDLYYRLNVFPIPVPPLRDRREDIPLLVWRFVDEFSEAYGKPIDAIDETSMAALQAYGWPGNARELRNVVERAMIVATGRRLHIPLPSNGHRGTRRNLTLAALEKEHITAILAACDGRMRGAGGAAARLGLSSNALSAKMAKLGIHPPPR